MFRRKHFLAKLLLAFLFVALGFTHKALIAADQKSSEPTEQTKQDASVQTSLQTKPKLIDYYHPKNFVNIWELDKSGGKLPIYMDDSFYKPRDIGYEVDKNSRIIIEFDREWIYQCRNRFQGDLSISASVVGQEGARLIGVRGYSAVGEAKRSSSARVKSVWEVAGILATIDGEIKNLFAEEPVDSLKGEAAKTYFYSKTLLNNRKKLEIPLKKIIDPANRDLIYAVTKTIQIDEDNTRYYIFDADVYIHYARQVLNDWYPMLEKAEKDNPSANTHVSSSVSLAVKNIIYNFSMLTNTIQIEGMNKVFDLVANELISSIKDADILLPETGAKVDDHIEIEIHNFEKDSSLHRILKIDLTVKEFGLKRKVSDSFLFLNRYGASHARPDTVGNAVIKVSEVQFEPSAGVTLDWTWLARKNEHPFIHWLKPGFGINVSFPRFGSEITGYYNSSMQAQDSLGISGSVVALQENKDDDIQIASGFIFSLFDGALYGTWGWNLSNRQYQHYYGVGFSFVNLVRKVSGNE